MPLCCPYLRTVKCNWSTKYESLVHISSVNEPHIYTFYTDDTTTKMKSQDTCFSPPPPPQGTTWLAGWTHEHKNIYCFFAELSHFNDSLQRQVQQMWTNIFLAQNKHNHAQMLLQATSHNNVYNLEGDGHSIIYFTKYHNNGFILIVVIVIKQILWRTLFSSWLVEKTPFCAHPLPSGMQRLLDAQG